MNRTLYIQVEWFRGVGFAILLLLLVGAYPASAGYIESSVSLSRADGVIHGTLLHPKERTHSPIAVLISGSGPTDRNGNFPSAKNDSLRQLAIALSRHGISSLRFDKRGIGESVSERFVEERMTIEVFAEDVVAWVNYLLNQSRYSCVFIVGHSEGSLVGMIAAQRSLTCGFISIAGAGVPGGQLLREQLKLQLSHELYAQSKLVIEQLESGSRVSNELISKQLSVLFRPSVQTFLMSWFVIDPRVEIKHVRVPVLIVHGSSDTQVPWQQAEMLASHSKDGQLFIVQDMNHVMKVVESEAENRHSYYVGDYKISPQLVSTIAAFVEAEVIQQVK